VLKGVKGYPLVRPLTDCCFLLVNRKTLLKLGLLNVKWGTEVLYATDRLIHRLLDYSVYLNRKERITYYLF